MKQVYLDNAATTPLIDEVIDEMNVVMKSFYGNPSSTHNFGRKTKNKIETYRKEIATHFGALPAEIIFTSNGTEANNIIVKSSVENHGVTHIITTEIEHKSVLNTAKVLANRNDIEVSFVNILPNGEIDYKHLEEILSSNLSKKTLVTLMLANNETGVLLDAKRVSDLCKSYDALFHSDTVQYVAHFPINFEELGIHFATCTAHKFHGPKGIGFLYAQKKMKLAPHIYGGGQERGVRSGTEDTIGIAGLAKALNLSYEHLEADTKHMISIRSYMIDQLEANFKDKFYFNGDAKNGLHTVLSVSFLEKHISGMLAFQLDMEGIAVSEGSACSSGSNQGSHVMRVIYGDDYKDTPLRFSFSKLTTKEDIDYCIEKLKNIIK